MKQILLWKWCKLNCYVMFKGYQKGNLLKKCTFLQFWIAPKQIFGKYLSIPYPYVTTCSTSYTSGGGQESRVMGTICLYMIAEVFLHKISLGEKSHSQGVRGVTKVGRSKNCRQYMRNKHIFCKANVR